MSPLDLIPAPYRIAAEAIVLAGALVAAGTCGWMVKGWKDDKAIAAIKLQDAAEHAAQAKAVSDQKDRNIELQRQAEKKYVVTQQAQDHYFTQTVKEIVHDAAPMASCPVPDSVRVRLNALAACASSDSPSACGADGEVPRP